MFGYMDESGSPGIAVNGNDWLVVSLVLFRDKEAADAAAEKLNNLKVKLDLPESYEFHRTHNSAAVQKEVERLLKRLDFKFITVGIKKNQNKTAVTYRVIAEQLVERFSDVQFDKMRIWMDENPTLNKHIARELKMRGIKGVRFYEVKSKKHGGVQIADYVVNLCARHRKRLSGAEQSYKCIAKKRI